MISMWCLLRGLSTILHLGPAAGALSDRGKEFTAPAGLGVKTRTQPAADVGASSATAGAGKTRESTATMGRPSAGKM